VTPSPIPIEDLSLWLASFAQPQVLTELSILAGCALAALAMVALLRPSGLAR